MSDIDMSQLGTEPPELLAAMLRLVRRKGCDATEVIGYRERSYNIGYCESCWDMVADVRIHYRKADGSTGHHQVEYTGLAELIRELTDQPEQRDTWHQQARHETDDERYERFEVHGYDEEPRS